MSELTRFSDALREDIDRRVAANGGEWPESLAHDSAVAESFAERLEEASYLSAPEFSSYCDTEGRNRCQFSGISYLEDERRLIIFVGHSTGSTGEGIRSVTTATLAQLAGRAARFLWRALAGDYNSFRSNDAAIDAARHVAAKRPDIDQVQILILTDGRARSRDFDDIEIDGLSVEFDVVDVERLYRVSQDATSREDIDIDLVEMMGRPLPCLEMSPRSSEYDTYLAILPGSLLYALYDKFGQRLFEFNVRSYLQAKGRVNKGIRDTLKNSPSRFMAYNNGIVATADAVEVGLQHGELRISKLAGLQIVNGAQTTASIHRAMKVDKFDLSHVAVAAKITRVDPSKLSEFVPLISQFANTQNSIHVADLSANSDFHIQLERLSQTTWCPGETTRWFYERARGAYEVAMLASGSPTSARRAFKVETPASQKISKTDIARYWLASAGRPHTVSLGAQKSFATFMAELPETFPAAWIPDANFFRDLVARAILYRAVERAVRVQKFPAYRANIVAYAVSYLFESVKGEVDLDTIWQEQGLSEELLAYLPTLTSAVDKAIRKTAGERNVTEWCKKPDCWDQVRKLMPSPPSPPPLELATQANPPEDPNEAGSAGTVDLAETNIDRCMEIDAATWSKLSHWGIVADRLTHTERGVCHTLAEYARDGWARKPTAKQAYRGVQALELARKDGLLDT